jgi:glucose/mannose transport system substrate-binding protein
MRQRRIELGRRRLLAVGLAAAVLALPACSADVSSGDGQDSGAQVEVFSWWAGPGEKDGLEAMIVDFKKNNPDVEFNNAAVAGGAGSNAKTVLATRLQNNNPPDSYQVHAGLELASDIKAGKVEDITYLYDQQGWKDKFPKGLVDAITVNGKIYSVPVNIHRSNLLWYNPKILTSAGITAPPRTWAEFLTQAATLKAKNVTALSMGPGWTQKHLLENVLLGELGVDRYNGLWNGKTDWKSAEVRAALTTFKSVLDVSDIKSAAGDWQPALDKVVSGTAAYNVMGDWADAYLSKTKALKFKTDYDVVTTPGSTGVYNFLSDSFTLPRGAPHKKAAEKWLVECGSVSGQDAFNPVKGSIPARIDADRAKYTGYLGTALADWTSSSTKVVGSLAHGVVANNQWNGEIDTSMGLFVQDKDVAKFADSVAKAYIATR